MIAINTRLLAITIDSVRNAGLVVEKNFAMPSPDSAMISHNVPFIESEQTIFIYSIFL